MFLSVKGWLSLRSPPALTYYDYKNLGRTAIFTGNDVTKRMFRLAYSLCEAEKIMQSHWGKKCYLWVPQALVIKLRLKTEKDWATLLRDKRLMPWKVVGLIDLAMMLPVALAQEERSSWEITRNSFRQINSKLWRDYPGSILLSCFLTASILLNYLLGWRLRFPLFFRSLQGIPLMR